MDIKALLHYYAPYKKTFCLIGLLVLIAVVLQFIILISVKPILSTSTSSVDVEKVVIVGLISLALIAVYSVVTIFVSSISTKTSIKVASNLREGLVKKVVSTPDHSDIGADTSGMMVRLMLDVDTIQKYTVNFFSVGVYFLFVLIATVILAAFISPFFFCSFLISLVLCGLIIYLFEKNEYSCRRHLQTMLEGCISMFRSFVDGTRSRRIYGQVKNDQNLFRTVNSEYARQADETRIRIVGLTTLAVVVVGASIMLVAVFSNLNPSFGEIQLSALTISIQLILLFNKGLGVVPFCLESIPLVVASMERVETVLASKDEASGEESVCSNSKELVRSGTGKFPSIVTGKETCIIGKNGAGKSVFIQTLVKFAEASPGDIIFDGQDITGVDPASLRKRIAYAGQMAGIFSGTVRNNICLWRDIPEDRLTAVCEAVGIRRSLDDKLDRSASSITSGDKDKISIARALVTDADLYIFDSCFIGLDRKTEMVLVGEIRRILAGKTVIFVSNNTDIAVGSDRVAIMDQGRLDIEGTLGEVRDTPIFIQLSGAGAWK